MPDTELVRDFALRKLGGIQSMGNVAGIFSPFMALSHKNMANMNSSQLRRPSLSKSESVQICANVACGNLLCTRIPRACTPVK